SRNRGVPSSTSFTLERWGIRRRGSSPASIRTALALSCSRKASSETAGSSIGSSFRKRRASAINSLLEGVEADATIGVEETFALGAMAAVAFDRALDRIDHTVLVEAGSGVVGRRCILGARPPEQQLVILGAFAIDAENAEVPRMVVTAGVDAARDLDLELAEVTLAVEVDEPLLDLLRDRNRSCVGKGAIIEPGAGDNVGHKVEVRVREPCIAQRFPNRVKINLADVRQDKILRMRRADIVKTVPLGEVGDDLHLFGGDVAADASDRLQADIRDRISRRLVRDHLLIDPDRKIGVGSVDLIS